MPDKVEISLLGDPNLIDVCAGIGMRQLKRIGASEAYDERLVKSIKADKEADFDALVKRELMRRLLHEAFRHDLIKRTQREYRGRWDVSAVQIHQAECIIATPEQIEDAFRVALTNYAVLTGRKGNADT